MHNNSNQNNPSNLELLAAQRQLYSKTKVVSFILFVFEVVLVALAYVLASFFPDLVIYCAYYSLSVFILIKVIFRPIVCFYQEEAAKIQELFDTNILAIPWNTAIVGSKPDTEKVSYYDKKYVEKHKNYSVLENWYPDKEQDVNFSNYRLICQRSNCYWNSSLRKSFIMMMNIFCALVGLSTIYLAISIGYTVENFLLHIFAPIVPLSDYFFTQITRHKNALEMEGKINTTVNHLFDRIAQNTITETELDCESHKIQAAIYTYRSTSPLIPDWFYWIKKQNYEDAMRKAAQNITSRFTTK